MIAYRPELKQQIMPFEHEASPSNQHGSPDKSSAHIPDPAVLDPFFTLISDMPCLLDEQLRFILAGPAWGMVLGYPLHELSGLCCLQLVHPDDLELTGQVFADLATRPGQVRMTNRCRTKNGEYRHIEWHMTVSGHIIYVLAHHLSGQELSNHQLRSQKEQFELAIQGSNDGIWDWNLSSGDLYLSPRWKDQLGYRDDELPSHMDSFIGRIHPDDLDRVQEYVQRYLDGREQNYSIEFRLRHKNGSYRWIWARGEALRDQNGQAWRMAGSHTDITDKVETEHTRRESERYLRTVLETSQDGFWVVGAGGRITDVNSAYCRMIGYSRDEILKMCVSDIDTDETPEQTYARIRRVIEQGSELFTTHHRCKDGTILAVEISVSCMNADPLMLVCFCRNITERLKAEKLLEHSHNLMRYIIEHNRSAVAIHDRELRYIYVSQLYLQNYRITDTDVIGRHHYDVLPDLPEKWRIIHQRALAGEIISAEEDPYVREDGTVEWTRWECRPWYDSNGQVGGIIVYTEMISDRKAMEQLIHQEKEQFRTTLLSVGDGVIATNEQARIVVINKVAEELTGWTQQEAEGQPLDQVFRTIDDSSQEHCINPADYVLETGDSMELVSDTAMVRRSGRTWPVEYSAAPIKDAKGVTRGVVLVFRDITERKEKQKQVLFLSFHDQLTGLYNRRFFEEELLRLDNQRNYPISVIMLDVNGLKLINDAFGHQVGDQLLQRAARLLQHECRSDDIIARTGGDEFVVLLPRTSKAQARQMIHRIKQAFDQETLEGVRISVSCGTQAKTDARDDMFQIIKQAEDQMYRDKISDRHNRRHEAIQMIMRTLHEKTPRERLHSRRVSELSRLIGTTLGMAQDEINELAMTAELHDIGKIAINNEILNKPGPLNHADWTAIRRHPEIGFNILSTVNEYALFADAVLSHHERWDGNGYPKGLAENAIPYHARIIAVADAYDAMTNDRPYRRALSEDEAMRELVNCAGTHFDPQIINALGDQLRSR